MNAAAQLTKEEEDLVLLLAAFPRSSAADLLKRLKPAISQPTLSRRIEGLEKRQIVRREGRARATVYTLVDARWYVNLPLGRRAAKPYDFHWLEQFVPDNTRLFLDEELRTLETHGNVPGVSANLFFQRVFERFLIDLSYASSKMEGNTYTLLDTERLIMEGAQAEGKGAQEAIMILNHKAAILHIVEHLADISISERDIKDIHALLSKDLVLDTEPGTIRSKIVHITNSSYSPLAVPQQLDEQFKLLVNKADSISSPYEQSLFLLAAISYLQPFIDVNKRTARLVANIPLFKAGLCPLSYRFMDASQYTGGLLLFYETLNFDGIKAAYMDGYVASSNALKQHYEEHRRQPDRIDVAYRRALDRAVREVVLYGHDKAVEARIVKRWLSGLPEDAIEREALLKRLEEKLTALTPEAAAMYELGIEEVEAFLEARSRFSLPPGGGPGRGSP